MLLPNTSMPYDNDPVDMFLIHMRYVEIEFILYDKGVFEYFGMSV